jgi:hypothetical protein
VTTLSITQTGPRLGITQVDTGVSITLGAAAAPLIALAVPGSISGPAGPIGPPGPAGATGPQGPEGPIGSVMTTYTFVQHVPASTWDIVHNLGRFPSVTVVDSANTQVEGDVTYVSANEITVGFTGGFAGEAYLN